jgi:hypothetical protein
MERNKVTIYYALYQNKVPILDEDGNETGEYETGYSNPVKFRIRVSPNKGDSSEQVFGKSLDYDRVMNTTEKRFQVDEYSILWVDKVPEIKEDGSTDTPHDFTVVRVAKDINEWLFAIKKVT